MEGVSSSKHIRRALGHSRFKHGEQGAGALNMVKRLESGEVVMGSVGPKTATTGTSKAPERCMSPLSLERVKWQRDKTLMAWDSDVRPARFITFWARRNDEPETSAAAAASPGPPSTMAVPGRLAKIRLAAWAKLEAGQRLAPPYAAPGAMASLKPSGSSKAGSGGGGFKRGLVKVASNPKASMRRKK